MSTPASEIYVVAGERRRGNALRWAATLVLGLLQVEEDAPSVSETVIRRVDGSLVKRLKPGSISHFEKQISEVTTDLGTMDAVPFAQKWIVDAE
ncbi:hypothetical protein [uncultured Microbacterium sp.]|uniref:hypothetical protein n=1 Tax=uncultured Microbacterium sp. TaxID=191216 RepID=UPI0025E69082|nr:hypothetical protein [uncultured Microbacterium sp.]